MAATITRIGDFFDKAFATERRIGQYTGPAIYATGGESLTPEQLALSRLDHLQFEGATDGTNVYLLVYNHTTQKVVWFDPSTGAEVGNGTDLSTFSARFEAIGR